MPLSNPLHRRISTLLQEQSDVHVFSFPDRQIVFEKPVAAASFAARLHAALGGGYEVQLNLPKAGDGKPSVSWL
jgi:hypothetical protein